MARRLTFLATCPACGDKNVGMDCKKPTFLTPTIHKVVCDKCECTLMFTITLPRNQEEKRKRGQIMVTPKGIVPSARYFHMQETAKLLRELEAEASKPEPTTEVVPVE